MKTLLKVLGILVAVVIVIVGATIAWVFIASGKAMKKTWTVDAATVAIPTDSTSIARGRHLSSAIAKCVDCHGENLGGTMFIDGMPFARVAAPNLTRGRGGAGVRLSDADFVRAIRHAVMQDGRAAIIMPAEAYIHLTDADLGAVIAYVKSVPPVDSAWPAPQMGLIGRMLIATGQAPLFPAAYIDHTRASVITPAADTTAAYGDYLTRVGGCRSCHNEVLSGGKTPGMPSEAVPSNLTPVGLAGWTEASFFTLLREGKRPDGRQLNNNDMPWQSSGRMTDDEIRAVWHYLQSIPPRQLGEKS